MAGHDRADPHHHRAKKRGATQHAADLPATRRCLRRRGLQGSRFKAKARAASPDEKPELWRIMTSAWPAYDEYQRNTSRDIPVVVLERAR
jgi:hypothetical protein